MDGNLYVWCGPFQRWRERYVLINNGQLNIYLSKNSKSIYESIYLTTANVSPVVNSQHEWIIQAPAKSPVYFKTSEPEERRRWLQLIGSVKACIADSSVLTKKGASTHQPICKEPYESTEIPPLKESSTLITEQDSPISVSPPPELYGRENGINHDVLNRHGIKQLIHPSVTTIQSLCDDLKTEVSKLQASCMQDPEFNTTQYLQSKEEQISCLLTDIKNTIESVTSKIKSQENFDDCSSDIAMSDDNKMEDNTDVSSSTCSSSKERVTTFFTEIEISFADVVQEALQYSEPSLKCSVHSQTFIDACIHHAKFFDLFAATLFSPLKSDILSNAEKVRQAFMKDRSRYVYLELIIEDEIKRKQHMHPDSASQAVVWTMRGLRTISRFLMTVCSRAHPLYKDTSQALGMAYQEHLSRYHNFIVQKMFSAGTRLLPSIDHFKKQVITQKHLDVSSEVIEDSIMQQAIAYSQSVMEAVRAIEKVFICHKIDL